MEIEGFGWRASRRVFVEKEWETEAVAGLIGHCDKETAGCGSHDKNDRAPAVRARCLAQTR
jgi:hypothetical protein